jgi:hypothetical protein
VSRCKTIIFIVAVLLSFSVPLCTAATVTVNFGNKPFNEPPEPRLRYPIDETAVIPAGQPLEFKWWNYEMGIRRYTIRIYRGYDMYAQGLIYKEDLPPGASSVKIDSSMFEDGQVYTWSLNCVSYAGYRSGRSFNSFRVIKQ